MPVKSSAIIAAAGSSRRMEGRDKLWTPLAGRITLARGARPLVTPDILEAGLKTAQKCYAAIAAVPVKDTIKQVQQGWITSTLDRSLLWSIQTPQVFSFPLIHHAYQTAPLQQEFTDDAALLEHLGKHVAIFNGSYRNIKITTQEDLLIAEALIKGLAAI